MLKKDDEKVLIGRYSTKGCYDQRFIKQVVEEVEKGMSRVRACNEYGLKKYTLRSWMRKFGSTAYKQTLNKRFTATIKRSVVRAVTEGRLSIKEAQAAYGINNSKTIKAWIAWANQQNDELSVITGSMAKTNKQQQTSSQDLQATNEDLKKQLEEAQLKIAALNTLIDVAEEQLKINIRKKPGAKQS
jgi:transposase-like protein